MSRGTALITGASSGIGAELAKLCAADGYDLILVARREDLLRQLASDLAGHRGGVRVGVRVLAADLSDPVARAGIFEAVRDDRVEILINNAGFGLNGPFVGTDWDAEYRMIQVNSIAIAHLTKLFLPQMVSRGSGRILNVASTAAFVPGPLMAIYYATKSFALSFSYSIANELRGTGVSVTVLCPGPTRTGFEAAAGMAGSRLFRGTAMSASDVARTGYAAMMAGKAGVIAGRRNRWMIFGTRFAPKTLLAKLARRLNSSVQ